jgi:hypothetical protein
MAFKVEIVAVVDLVVIAREEDLLLWPRQREVKLARRIQFRRQAVTYLWG